MKTPLNYILFDWDGCLVDTLPLWISQIKAVCSEYGRYPTDEFIVANIFGNWERLKREFDPQDGEKAAQEVLARVNERMNTVVLNQGAKETLIAIKNFGKKTAIVSTGSITTVKPASDRLGVTKYIDVFVCTEDVEKHKPDPEAVFYALKKLNGVREESCMIGDGPVDIQIAKNAGIMGVLYYPKSNEKIYPEASMTALNPDLAVKSFAEFQKLVSEN